MVLASLKKADINGTCPICYDNLSDPKGIVITRCSHAFHDECMTTYFSYFSKKEDADCPYCRQIPIPMVRSEEIPDDLENPYIESKMYRALREGDLAYIDKVLSATPQLIDEVYESKTTRIRYPILTSAAMFGHTDLVAVLLDKIEKNSIDALSSNGLTALSTACFKGHTEIAKLLIDAGASVGNINQDGKDAFFFAVSSGKQEIMELLVKSGSSVTNKCKKSVTPLILAAERGNLEAVNYIISMIPKEKLKEHVNICSSAKNATSALYLAAQGGHVNVVASLLSADADPNQPIEEGDLTPLQIAAFGGHLEVVKLLLANEADVNYQEEEGITALFGAASKGHREVCKCLLEANANPALGHHDLQMNAADAAKDGGYFALAHYITNYRR